MTRSRVRVLLWSVAAVAAVLVGVAWYGPSPDYLYVPNKATPVASKVTVEGEKQHATGPGALYFVDVSIRRASWAEKLLAFTRPDGSTLVPHDQVVPPGSSFEARHEDVGPLEVLPRAGEGQERREERREVGLPPGPLREVGIGGIAGQPARQREVAHAVVADRRDSGMPAEMQHERRERRHEQQEGAVTPQDGETTP